MLNGLIALFPCQTLEDFDLERREGGLLSAWSALWPPALLADAQMTPAWLPASCPPLEPAGNRVVVPECCESSLPDRWLAEAEAAGACVLRRLRHRKQIVAAALERLGSHLPTVDQDLTVEFSPWGNAMFRWNS